MADDKPEQKCVMVESIQWHTYNGKEYPVGATYEIDEQLVASVTAQGKAIRVDRVEHAEAQQEAAKKAASHHVSPIGTQDFPGTPPTK